MKSPSIVITSRESLQFYTPSHRAILISITDEDSEDIIVNRDLYECILRFKFSDIEGESMSSGDCVYRGMNKEEAEIIWKEILSGEYEEIVCQCEAGFSRSPALAAALSKYFTGDDNVYFKNFIPNNRVYRLMMETAPKKEQEND